MFFLADAVAAVDCLVFYRRVPPRVNDEDVVGFGQVQAGAARFGADEEDAHGVVGLEVFDFGFAVARLPVKVFVGDVFGVKARLNEAEHFDEAGEDEDFVRAGFFFDVFQQQVEFGGVVAVVFAVGKERRAVADLSQFEQAVQDVQLAFFDAVGGDLVQQLFAVAFFGRVVEFALRRAHVAVEDAFGFGRQFGRDLFFAAPQDEGVDEFGKERGAGFVFVFVDGVGEGAFEVAVVAEQSWVEEVHLCVEVEGVVFDRCAGQAEAVFCFEQAHGFVAL